MINDELARVFERIADLLELDGADRFRINSYRKAGRTLEDCTEDVANLAAEGRLTELPGIGKGTAGRIEQYLATGKIDVLSELEAKLPPGLPGLLEIQGLGPKKVAAMHAELNVQGLDDLERVIESGALAELSGFGATSVKRISEGIAFLRSSGGRTPARHRSDHRRTLPGPGSQAARRQTRRDRRLAPPREGNHRRRRSALRRPRRRGCHQTVRAIR